MSLFTCWEQWSHASVLSDFRHLTLEGIRGGGVNLYPLEFFGLKFLFLDRLPKALAQLFFAC